MGSTIGILGDGQLARMLCQEAARMDVRTVVFGKNGECVDDVADLIIYGEYDQPRKLREFAREVNGGVVTVESENIPPRTLLFLQQCGLTARPSARVLLNAQDRLNEKCFAQVHGIDTTKYCDLWFAFRMKEYDLRDYLPGIVKTNREGYDGKGQVYVGTIEELRSKWPSAPLGEYILERRVDFQQEVSVIVARNQAGDVVALPPVVNIHREGILRRTIYDPGLISETVAQKVTKHSITLAQKLGVVGLLACEWFDVDGTNVLFNEMAPRPHNSGHWTIEACETNQFRLHLQAILGLPFTAVRPRRAEMINLIDHEIFDASPYERRRNAHVHLYGKSEIRKGRKMGHVTIVHQDQRELVEP